MQMSIGYQFANSHFEEKRALSEAFELVRKARHLGLDARKWAKQTQWESRSLIARLQKDAGLTVAMKLWEIACLESKIITGIRNYMTETSGLMNNLKPLNPPLRNDQIKSFWEAMVSDRNVTVQALSPLTQVMTDLMTVKPASAEGSPAFGYAPSA